MNDAELLHRYVQEGSQAAFAELVTLRIGMVYSAALRQTAGDAHRAQDATQMVFTDLALKAPSLCRHPALIGWLYTSTHYAVMKLARTERRRRDREQEAYAMQADTTPTDAEISPERLRPLLDDAMRQLSEADRRAVLLRYFDGQSLDEIGRSLGLSAPAAQKRVERALAKLRSVLARRGLPSTAAAVGAALSHEAAAASVPSGLATVVSGSALATVAAAAGSVGFLTFLTAPLAVAAGVAALVLASAVGVITYESHVGLPTPAASPVTATVIGFPPVSSGRTGASGARENDPVESEAPHVSDWPPTVSKPTLADRTASVTSPAVELDPHPVLPAAETANPPVGIQIFDPAQLDHRPVPASPLRLNYPLEMRRQGIAGDVEVEFTVGPDGRVHQAVAVKSSRPEFAPAAVEAVSNWKFKPGRRGGHPVDTRVRAPIHFNPDSHD